jgi:putative endonuclease
MAAMARRSGTPREPKPPASAARPKREARPEKIAAFGLGISAESRAAAWLIAHGYRILARRWKSPLGEIDIIATRRHTLIFVEVKARATLDGAAESVTERQKHRIAAAAEAWLASYPQPTIRDMRFDAILVARGACRATSRRRSNLNRHCGTRAKRVGPQSRAKQPMPEKSALDSGFAGCARAPE